MNRYKVLISSILLISALNGYSQCSVFKSPSSALVCPGDSVNFLAFPYGGSMGNAAFDFNVNVLPTGWSVSGDTLFGTNCLPSMDATNYFWSSTSSTAPIIEFVTAPLDLSNGGSISFEMLYGIQGSPSPCEGPDLGHEGVSVQFSTDFGVTWYDIRYYSPGGYQLPANPYPFTGSVATGPTNFTSWNTFMLYLPTGAWSPNTMFRWIQLYSSGSCCDNWGLDNILIYDNAADYTINWSTGALDTNMIDVLAQVDSTIFIEIQDSLGIVQCTDSVTITINPNGVDITPGLVCGNAVVGSTLSAFLFAENLFCTPCDGQVVMILDQNLSFVSSFIPPLYIAGDTLVWSFTNMNFTNNNFLASLVLDVDQNAVAGSFAMVDVYVNPCPNDINYYNNAYTYPINIVASYDPNDKNVVPRGDCEAGYITNDQTLRYTVRFQNTGTYPAMNIKINDLIDPNLDLSSLRIISTSHEMSYEIINSNEIEFQFDDIWLPQGTPQMTSNMGFVVYELDQLQGLSNGDEIENYASIYFDFNTPIITNMVLNTISDGFHLNLTDTLVVYSSTPYNWEGQTYYNTGLYSAPYLSVGGCDSTQYLQFYSTTGINNFDPNAGLRIVPNPAKNQFKLVGEFQTGKIKVMSYDGKVVYAASYSTNNSIDISEISTGPYIVEFYDEGIVRRYKMIKE